MLSELQSVVKKWAWMYWAWSHRSTPWPEIWNWIEKQQTIMNPTFTITKKFQFYGYCRGVHECPIHNWHKIHIYGYDLGDPYTPYSQLPQQTCMGPNITKDDLIVFGLTPQVDTMTRDLELIAKQQTIITAIFAIAKQQTIMTAIFTITIQFKLYGYYSGGPWMLYS